MIDDSDDNASKSKVYGLASELYAIKGENEKSLRYYQMYHLQLQKEQLEKARKKHPQDKFILYSFRKYNEYSLSDLISNEISFGKPSVMNDPFDTVVINWSRKEHLKTICEETTHISPFSNSFEYYRLRSFVGNEDFTDYDETYAKILMWSHYADYHKGFCVKYELSKNFVFHQDDDKLSMRILLPIEYSKKKQPLSKKSMDYINAFRTKAKAWEYENEIRLLSYNTQSDSSFISEKLDAKSCIKEIVFGYSCPQSTIRTIRNLFRSNADIHFSQMEIDKSVDIYTLIKKPL